MLKTANGIAILLASLPFVTGCVTRDSNGGPAGPVRISDGSYQTADARLSNDIKAILSQGGLDASNPSVAKSDAARPGSAVAGDLPPAGDVETLVAQISGTVAPPPTVVAASAAVAAPKPSALGIAPQRTSRSATVFESVGVAAAAVPVPRPSSAPAPASRSNDAAASPSKGAAAAPPTATSYEKPRIKRF